MDICLTALEATRLDNLHGTVRAGGYEVRRRGDALRIRHRWNPALEAADISLEHATIPGDLPEITPRLRSGDRPNGHIPATSLKVHLNCSSPIGFRRFVYAPA